ncbi:2Fe-2S iron-sulfur cluster binding domain-containing protein [Gilvimarinus sp. SDUM040013]|uniref:2Fe-2S iron-sulfur cluster binding domain-containing protein n=1 Tax=Gilvimarinus gilvus TaxID=3058038 RepID=A0ABU4S009_9GAMM|nr:2Fe-2S iron-sulfur cluster binding domain-containing protein [Gilvimarinus sp. SDUM040013]MDO3385215.1 2Fe-2S iron-sulfur cluster binding domain-containing protein [Gilvimarinus sp. SDUM040013]MDX6849198.1 2Fe-2S iron-sulfur cluster binding domain-containing protein [Gilvimarinus sp. SDUM040013]
MTKILFEHHSLPVPTGKNVLDTLLEANQQIPYSCRQGVCQSCLVKVETGFIPPQAQAGLSSDQINKKLILSCSCYPDSDMELQRYSPKDDLITAQVASKRLLRPDILELKLDAKLKFRAGQYVTLWRDEQIARSFSLASMPDERFLSFHMDIRPNGLFSQWAHKTLKVGDTLGLQGPIGECYYQGNTDRPLLLAATGTGIAPLAAIAQDALNRGHEGDVHFLACARHFDSLYWSHELQRLARSHPQFKLRLLALEGPPPHGGEIADVYSLIRNEFAPLNDFEVYICGAASFVGKLRKQCFLAGVKPRNVFCDAFEAGG